jgi:hypothetical protein
MATQWQTFPIQFKGGLMSNVSPLQQGTNNVGSATILQNFEPNKEGGYSKLKGFTKFSTTVVPGSGVVLGCKVINASKAVVARSDGTLTEYHYSTGTSWTSLGDGTALGGKVRSADFNFDGTDKVIFVDGINYPAIFNNSTNALAFLTAPAAIESASHVAIFKNIAFYANGSILNYSSPFTPDTFGSASGSLKVSTPITGLAVFREQLIIFGENSIHKLTGNSTTDFAVTSITEKIGCLNADSIQEVGGDIMYMSPDGIRLLSATDRIGDFGLDIASDPIAKDVNTFINSATSFSSIVIREKAQYRIFAYTSSEQADQAKGLLATKFSAQGSAEMAWATISGIKANVADSKYTGASETIFFANEDGYIYKMEIGSAFDGANIEAIYESPYMPIADPQVRKTFYKLTSYVEPTGTMSLDIGVKFDFNTSTNTGVMTPAVQTISSTGNALFTFGSTSSVYGTATYGGQFDNVYNNNLIGSGKTISLRFSDLSTNPSFTLDTAVIEFQPNDRQ